MATFHVTSPDGATYEINAPDDASDADVLSYAQQNHAPQQDQPSEPATVPYAVKNQDGTINPWKTAGGSAVRYLTNAGQGLFGATDEVAAGIRGVAAGAKAALTGNPIADAYSNEYDSSLANIRKTQQEFEAEHPYLSMLGQGSSGLIATAPLAAMGASAPGTSVVKQMVNAAKVGAPIGGVTGFMSGQGGVDNRLGSAAGGAALYGLTSAAVPPLVAGASAVSKGAGSLLSRFYQNPETIDDAGSILAAKNVGDILKRDSLTPSALPIDQNMLQAGDKGAVARAEAIATRGGPGADAIANYAAQQRNSLPNDLSATLGSNFAETNYPALLDAIKLKAKTEAGPAYEAAYSALTKINDPQINSALDRAVAAGDWPVLTSEARKLAAYDGRKLGNIDATGAIRSFSTQDLDYMTRALRNLGQSTEGMGAMGNRTPLGAMRANTAMSIRDRLMELNPEFEKASTQYGNDIALHEAAQTGKQANLLGNNWKQAVYDYQQLGPTEQKAWRLGQAENLQTMIANNPGAALSRMNSPQFSKVMRNFYSPNEYQSLIDGAKQTMKQMNQIKQISGNSRTVARAIQQVGDKADDASVAETVLNKGPKGAIKDWLMDHLVNRMTNTPIRRAADAEVARTITSSPFQLSGGEIGGGMSNPMLGALTGRPSMYGAAPQVPYYQNLLLPFYAGMQTTNSGY